MMPVTRSVTNAESVRNHVSEFRIHAGERICLAYLTGIMLADIGTNSGTNQDITLAHQNGFQGVDDDMVLVEV